MKTTKVLIVDDEMILARTLAGLTVDLTIYKTTEGEGGEGDGDGEGGEGDGEGGGDSPFASYSFLQDAERDMLQTLQLDEDGQKTFKGILDRFTPPAEAPESYTLPEGMEEGQVDMDLIGRFGKEAAEAGFPISQEMMSFIAKFQVGMQPTAEEIQEENEAYFAGRLAEMQTELGATESEKAITGSQKVIDTFASKDQKEFLEASGLSKSPELIQFLASIASAMSEDSFKRKEGDDNSGGEETRDERLKSLYPSMQS